MESKSNKLQRYNQFKQLMLDSLTQEQKENHPLSIKLLQSIILLHTLNVYYGLKALNQNDQIVQFDLNWARGKQNVYKLRYLLPNNKQGANVNVLFRFVDLNGELNVNFCVQGESQLQSYSIKEADFQDDIQKKHVTYLQKILPKKKPQNIVNQQDQPFLRPVPLMRPTQRQPNVRPMPFNKPENLPFDNPFGKQQYVGPNSSIFSNGRYNPGFQAPNPLERYDPVDPFDYKNRIQPPDEFQGFDQFGQPINKPRLPKGPFIPGGNNPFNRQPPGSGGGFGGFNQGNFF